ncbi:unnamed protein product [Diatraea saccharalis]|uniref:Peptidylglycine monooxygenase n=1 Tax=Diatraea saccharalis TaxID=40085 RepID=A0A9N9RIE9_9NEOP|nr:unnamed protein product [Diatraea saccharalis]
MHTAHHMLLYGCSEPGSNDSVWSCGEMQSNEIDDRYNTASPCRTGSQIVYAWARDAPSLQLPEDVGFLIGKDSAIKYLVLQIHYMHRFPENTFDNSGVFLKYTKTPMRREAGVLLLGTGGVVGARRVEHMETACVLREHKTIHPFAFRTHTHALVDLNCINLNLIESTRSVTIPPGTVVSGYAIRRGPGGDSWRLLGRRSPQLPQMFYPAADAAPVRGGDALAARCTMNNTRAHAVSIGTFAIQPTSKQKWSQGIKTKKISVVSSTNREIALKYIDYTGTARDKSPVYCRCTRRLDHDYHDRSAASNVARQKLRIKIEKRLAALRRRELAIEADHIRKTLIIELETRWSR